MTKTKIVIHTPDNDILTFFVDDYELRDGFVFFKDPRTTVKELRGFPTGWCELTEVVR